MNGYEALPVYCVVREIAIVRIPSSKLRSRKVEHSSKEVRKGQNDARLLRAWIDNPTRPAMIYQVLQCKDLSEHLSPLRVVERIEDRY